MNRDQLRTNGGYPQVHINNTNSQTDVPNPVISENVIGEYVQRRSRVRYCPSCDILYRPNHVEWRSNGPFCPVHGIKLERQ